MATLASIATYALVQKTRKAKQRSKRVHADCLEPSMLPSAETTSKQKSGLRKRFG